MNLKRDYAGSFYALLPDKYTDYIAQQARYARMGGHVELTAKLIWGYLLVLPVGLYFVDLPVTHQVIAYIVLTPFSLALPYIVYALLAERRKKHIEKVLPDALLLMSANIESGMTVDKAFLLSARDEFGPLADDIRGAAMKMFSGTPADQALQELADDTNSELFQETLKLLIDGINSGGQVSKLLESSADDIRNSLHLRQEIAANVQMYSIFILMASVLGAPVLFAVSTYLTETTSELWGGQSDALADVPTSGPLAFNAPEIDVEFFRLFAIASLIIANAFAALIISEIKNGNVKSGFKFVPVFTILSVVIYFVVNTLIQSTLGASI